MIKVIRMTVDKQPKEVVMDAEEMLLKFDDMFNQFAHQCVQKTSNYQGCVEEFDDFKQMARIKAVEKFETYDISKDANFSTLLFKVLRELIVDIIRKNESQMRKTKDVIISIDAPLESGDSAGEGIADKNGDAYFEDEATELEKYLSEKLTKEEIMFYTIDLKKQINKASSKHKLCLQHTIDSFTMMVGGYIPDKKEDLAILLDMSRPTLNKRIKETVIKVRELAIEFCLINMPLKEVSL